MPSEDVNEQIVHIDVTNELAFKSGVVQTLQLIASRTACIPDMKKKVDKHESIVRVGSWASVPVLAAVSAGVKHFFAMKFGGK